MTDEPPELVIDTEVGAPGLPPPGLWIGICLFSWCALAIVGAALQPHDIGWIPIQERASTLALAILGGILGPPTLTVFGILLSLRRLRRRAKVLFRRDRIDFARANVRTSFAWVDIAGYRDGSADVVAIVPDRGFTEYVPTLDDRTRARVLALLDAHGLERLER